MPCNLLQSLRHTLKLPVFEHTTAPANEALPPKTSGSAKRKLAQGTVMAVLVALYESTRARKLINAIADAPLYSDWTAMIFGENKKQVEMHIASYSGFPVMQIEQKLKEVARTAIAIIRDYVSKDEKYKYSDIHELLLVQRNYILPYLPPSLEMNTILKEYGFGDSSYHD